jgi:RNA 3'-terminal phosphate cyclase (ATP)
MITIDGSFGEGGGQIVRSSLALALVTGQPVEINHIRAGRSKPGLMRQHLTAVQAAAQVGQAAVDGAALGSSHLVFRPRGVVAGDYHFPIGTAGSTTLVLQTVLPALIVADGPSRLVLEGGTHNPAAPPFEFLARTFLPIVNRMGPRVSATLQRPGFYPAGGGRIEVAIEPARQFSPLVLLERGEVTECRVRALVANLPRHIADRECRQIARRTDWDDSCFQVQEIKGAPGPGNVVTIEIGTPHLVEVFTGFGARGVRAEAVADAALRQARRYLDADVPVGEHLADQLLLPLGISAARGGPGGTFRSFALSPHAATHIEVLRAFLDLRIELEETARDDCRVSCVRN